MRVEGRAEFPHRHVALCRSCTSTTLSLFDWLKLEDISISLFFVTVSRRNKKRHRLGQRQPRYMKFFQVCPGSLLRACCPSGFSEAPYKNRTGGNSLLRIVFADCLGNLCCGVPAVNWSLFRPVYRITPERYEIWK